MSEAQGSTRKLCARIGETTFDSLGDDCIARVKQAISDRLGRASISPLSAMRISNG